MGGKKPVACLLTTRAFNPAFNPPKTGVTNKIKKKIPPTLSFDDELKDALKPCFF